jgi:hypothetical protein
MPQPISISKVGRLLQIRHGVALIALMYAELFLPSRQQG